MSLSTSEAQLPAFMVESVFYGIYLVTFFACLQRLLRNQDSWKPARDINLPMTLVVLLLFVSSSLNLALALVRNMRGFVYDLQFDRSARQVGQTWLTILKPSLLIFQTLLADSVLLYRCWIIWNRTFLVIFMPLLCWMGCLACSIYALYSLYLDIMLQSGSIIISDNIFIVFAAFWGCTILINIYCTSMIVWKICSVERAWTPPSICSLRDVPQRGRLQFARRIVIESGLMYTTMTIILFINHVCRSNAIYITSAAEIQITGIAFNLILARTVNSQPAQDSGLPSYRAEGVGSFESPESRSTGSAAVMTAGSASDKP